MAKFIEVDLVAHIGKSLSEGHDEVLDVVNDFFLNDPFINIFIPFAKLLDIDKVKKVFVLEHLDSPECLFVIRDGLDEIVGNLTLIVEGVFGNLPLDSLHTQFLVIAKLDIEYPFFQRLDTRKDGGMMSEAYA